ncbi:MAG: hypothetical protein VW268_12370 [Rhodospirillaceae bacterium]
MAFPKLGVLLAGAVLVTGACSFDKDLWPSLDASDPAGKPAQQTSAKPAPATASAAQTQQAAAPQQVPSSQPALGTTNFQPQGVTPGASTGTFVGKKVEELRQELRKLQTSIMQHNEQLQAVRSRIVENSQKYHGTIAAVKSRLQVGTTRGNPVLVQQFNAAQQDLNRLSQDVGEMNKLSTGVASDSTLASFLTESVRAAYKVSGAVDEDHRQLAILEDEVDRTVVLIDRLNREVTEDVRRQSSWIGAEQRQLVQISAGIRQGESLQTSLLDAAVTGRGSAPNENAQPANTSGRRPLVVIRFDRPNVPYQQALYTAVSRALESHPTAVFDLVAVAPSAGGTARVAINTNKAKRHADDVKRSLVEMGLPPTRVAVSSRTLAAAKTNEVHLYVR